MRFDDEIHENSQNRSNITRCLELPDRHTYAGLIFMAATLVKFLAYHFCYKRCRSRVGC